jgi:hypothetical protein
MRPLPCGWPEYLLSYDVNHCLSYYLLYFVKDEKDMAVPDLNLMAYAKIECELKLEILLQVTFLRKRESCKG